MQCLTVRWRCEWMISPSYALHSLHHGCIFRPNVNNIHDSVIVPHAPSQYSNAYSTITPYANTTTTTTTTKPSPVNTEQRDNEKCHATIRTASASRYVYYHRHIRLCFDRNSNISFINIRFEQKSKKNTKNMSQNQKRCYQPGTGAPQQGIVDKKRRNIEKPENNNRINISMTCSCTSLIISKNCLEIQSVCI